jgi:hypothetical protein
MDGEPQRQLVRAFCAAVAICRTLPDKTSGLQHLTQENAACRVGLVTRGETMAVSAFRWNSGSGMQRYSQRQTPCSKPLGDDCGGSKVGAAGGRLKSAVAQPRSAHGPVVGDGECLPYKALVSGHDGGR